MINHYDYYVKQYKLDCFSLDEWQRCPVDKLHKLKWPKYNWNQKNKTSKLIGINEPFMTKDTIFIDEPWSKEIFK